MHKHLLRPTCAHCVFWVNDHTGVSSTAGHCHRYPPVIHVKHMTDTIVQSFPMTDQHHWCGEWTDDDATLVAAAKRSVVNTAMHNDRHHRNPNKQDYKG